MSSRSVTAAVKSRSDSFPKRLFKDVLGYRMHKSYINTSNIQGNPNKQGSCISSHELEPSCKLRVTRKLFSIQHKSETDANHSGEQRHLLKNPLLALVRHWMLDATPRTLVCIQVEEPGRHFEVLKRLGGRCAGRVALREIWKGVCEPLWHQRLTQEPIREYLTATKMQNGGGEKMTRRSDSLERLSKIKQRRGCEEVYQCRVVSPAEDKGSE